VGRRGALISGRRRRSTLTVEPNFKSSGSPVAEELLTIGEVSTRAGVATSAVRYHERRGLLAAALLCRYDHPATDCRIMGAEIDRRLGA